MIQLYRSGVRRRYRWRYVAPNGLVLADSGQAYTRRIDALLGAASVTGTRLMDDAKGERLVGWSARTIPVKEVGA